jgi:5-methylcytosine-specific restriction endonuclease McrA
MDTKICTKCGLVLATTEFYRDTKMKDRKMAHCKSCTMKDVKNYIATEEGQRRREEYRRSDAYKESVRKTNRSPKARMNNKRHRQTEKGKAAVARSVNKRRSAIAIMSTLTAEEWGAIKKRYKYRCVYCGEEKKLTMDHIIPVSKGGHHTKENIVPACLSCNVRKKDKMVLLQLLVVNQN